MLTPLELAREIKQFKDDGHTVEETSKKFNKHTVTVYKYISLLRLIPEVLELITKSTETNKKMFSFAKLVLIKKFPDEQQLEIATGLINRTISSKQANDLIFLKNSRYKKRLRPENFKELISFADTTNNFGSVFSQMSSRERSVMLKDISVTETKILCQMLTENIKTFKLIIKQITQ